MEAAVVSVSHGAIGSLLGKLGDLLAGEYKLLKEAKGEIMFLKAELESMRVFLERMSDAEEEADKQAKCWAEEVRDLSYDIEDNIDDFMLRVECESDSKPHGFKGFIERSMNLLTTINTRHKIGKELQGLKRRVMEVSGKRMRYKVDGTASKPNSTAIDIRLLALYADTAGLVGINEPRDALIKVMLDGDGVCSEQLKVLSVVGFGGLGKTTLANEIYRKLEGQFQCQAFVSMSQKPNIRKILTNILSQAGYVAPDQTNMETWDEDQLIGTLRRFLADKRYFIVIDDIWDVTTWSIVRCALPENMNGSRVITTTRIENVATACCSNSYDYLYKMKLLSNEESRKLFFRRVFGSEDGCPTYLEGVWAEILRRCGGLPLAIISISSLLASQPKMLKAQWEDISNSLDSNFEVHSTLDGMRKILNLSYRNLPRYLKTCMLSLGIYPEDYTINKNDLVRQWLAQGFISISHMRDPEAVAEGYFNELINRSIIQPVDTDHNDEVLSCKVRDMMLDLIMHKCREENFITAIDDLQAMIGLQGNVRRLSLYLDGVIDGTILGSTRLSQVRALARFGISTYMPPLSEFKHLRVLTLEFPTRLVTLDLTGMCHLFQLRCLKVVAAYGEIVLPRKIRRLEQLETLELRTYEYSMVQVPSDIVHLRRLLYLIVPIGVSLPSRIGSMKSLRTLRGFDLGMNSIDNIRDLGDLTNLKDLEICRVYQKQLDEAEATKLMNILRFSLEKLCNLRYLCMESYFPSACSDALSSLSASPRLLRRLHLRGCMLSRVPKWIRELDNLYDLALGVKEVLDDGVGIIAQLHSLIHLNVYVFGTPKERATICGTGFLALKHFIVTCARISYLTFEAGAMPKLQRLEVGFNARGWEQHGAAFVGIEHLSGLKEVSVRIGGYGAEESTARDAQSVLRDAIGMHPSCPTANIKCDENMSFTFDD